MAAGLYLDDTVLAYRGDPPLNVVVDSSPTGRHLGGRLADYWQDVPALDRPGLPIGAASHAGSPSIVSSASGTDPTLGAPGLTVAFWYNMTTAITSTSLLQNSGAWSMSANAGVQPQFVVTTTSGNTSAAGAFQWNEFAVWYLYLGRWAAGGPANLRIYRTDGTLRSNTTGATARSGTVVGGGIVSIGDANGFVRGIFSDILVWPYAISDADAATLADPSFRVTWGASTGPVLSSPHLINHLDPSQLLSSPHLLGSFP